MILVMVATVSIHPKKHKKKMTARDLLLYDYRHRLFPASIAGDSDPWEGWGIDFENASASTTRPTPREHYSSLFLTVNHTDNPIHDFRQFIKALNRDRRTNMQVVVAEDGSSGSDSQRSKLFLQDSDTGKVLLEGDIHKSGDPVYADPNVGFYAQFMATNEEEWQLVRTLGTCATHGYGAIVEHTGVEFDIGNGLILSAQTGVGPLTSCSSKTSGLNNNCNAQLATQFTVANEEGTEVAKCHLSYRDASWDPSVGPTLEGMTVHQNSRGRVILPLLWHWVKSYCQENWTLECMNNDTPPGHIMIKATNLTNKVVDAISSADANTEDTLICDKEFYYNYAGFGVRQQHGMMANMMAMSQGESSGIPLKDDEAVLYTKLLSRQEINKRGLDGPPSVWKEVSPGQQVDVQTCRSPPSGRRAAWKQDRGPKRCEYCHKEIAIGKNLRCSRCKRAFYCSAACQRADWKPRHKHSCGKKKGELAAFLVEKGWLPAREAGKY